MRAAGIALFVITLLLSIGTMEATAPWLITITVLAGLLMLRVGLFGGGRRRRWRRAWAGPPWDEDDY